MNTNNIYNKVKTLAMAAVVTSATGVMTSCNDFLEVEPQDLITLEKFWNEKSDVDAVVSGCYEAMMNANVIARIYTWGEFRSENCINVGTLRDVNLERVLKEDINASNGYTYWGDFYRVINGCNTFLKFAPQVAENDPSYTQSQLNAHKAEVTALRSLAYFYLIRTFRDVPYVEEAYLDDTQKQDLPQTDFNTILQKLISSLEEVEPLAVTKYPAVSNESRTYYNTGRITQCSIWAMLCEMHLWAGNYDECIRYAQKVIDFKKKEAEQLGYEESDFKDFYGYPLIRNGYKGTEYFGNDFASIFGGNSMEGIFELSYVKGDRNGLANSTAAAFFGNFSDAGMVTASSYVSIDEAEGVYSVFDKRNNKLDQRGFLNFTGTNNAPIAKNTVESFNRVNKDGKSVLGGSLYDKMGSANPNKANVIIYRLTDIMLLKAEAHVLKISGAEGDLQEKDLENRDSAFVLVDAVNRRALMQSTYTANVLKSTDYTTKEQILNLVYEERERELMFEGKRYYDLVRRSMREGNTEYLAEHVCNKDDKLKSAIKNKFKSVNGKIDYIFWPIQLEETKANPNLKQNTAFGSGENSSYKKVTE